MKRSFSIIFALTVLVSAITLMSPVQGNAGIPLPPLPPLVIPAPPPLFVIPGTYVYYPPDVDVDIFFYHGYWYRPYGGGWYRAGAYNGPWRTVSPNRVPRALISVPPAYRHVPPGHERLEHGRVQKNWRTWEKERHWDNPRGGNGGPGRGKGKGRGRGNHGND